MKLDSQIEAILFYKSEAVSIKKLGEMLKVGKEEIDNALNALENSLAGRGVTLMRNGDEVKLATSIEASDLIQSIVREELSKDLSKAGLETLSIILYKGPISRSKIDYIRGVNSTFIIRNLLVRGLIEKDVNVNDSRSFLYKPTFELLQYLGVSKVTDLPEYEKTGEAISAFTESITEEGKGVIDQSTT